MALMTVKNRPGSRRFGQHLIKGGMISQYQKDEVTNQDVEAGTYSRERFPNSRQIIRPMYSLSQKRWSIAGFTGKNQEEAEKLNKLVVKCKLKYEDGPMVGQQITTADIHDMDDPFFTHKKMGFMMKEGEAVLDKDDPIHQVLILSLQGNHQFAVAGSDVNPVLSKRVRYILTDSTTDRKVKKTSRINSQLANKLYEKLTDERKLRIAIAMGLTFSDKTDREVIDEILWDAAFDQKTKVGGRTRQEIFITMCEADSEQVDVQFLMQKARKSGILKQSRSEDYKGWLLFGQRVGFTLEQVTEYFHNPTNQKMVGRVEESLKREGSLPLSRQPQHIKDETGILAQDSPGDEEQKKRPVDTEDETEDQNIDPVDTGGGDEEE